MKETLLKDTLKIGFQKGLQTLFKLLKIILPVYSLVIILKHTQIITIFADWASPVMKLFGLPGESIMVLLSGYLINIYAAIGVAAGLELSIREINILGVMLGISHSLIIETAIIKQIEVKTSVILLLRIATSLFIGLILNIII